MNALGDLYESHKVQLDGVVVGMAHDYHTMHLYMMETFGMKMADANVALAIPMTTIQYKLGDITDDIKRDYTQKAISDIIGRTIRPRSRNAKKAVVLPDTENDKKLMLRIMQEYAVKDGETQSEARKRLMEIVNQMTGTRAKKAGITMVNHLISQSVKGEIEEHLSLLDTIHDVEPTQE